MGILDLFRLDGKTALITGARRGIGLAMADALAQAGADIVAVSVSLEPSGSEIEKRVIRQGRRFYGYSCDFADRTKLYDFIRTIQQECPPIDVLVNNAGTILRKPAVDHPDEYWDRVLEVNLSSQFILTREFGRAMIERQSGKVIFTASLLTFQGGITVPSYAASKGGIGQLTMAFANEWASKGVNVNAIAPGYIATDTTQTLSDNSERNLAILQRIPAGRWGVPDDLAGAVVYLASSASNYVNGTILTIDGGWMGR